jgi:hypothetical protein
MYVIYKYYIPKKKSPDDDTNIPPNTAVGAELWVAITTTLLVSILNISCDPDCTKKKLGKPTFTDAVTDPVAIYVAFPPPVPGNDEVTNKALLTASYKTVLTFAEGEYGVAKVGTVINGALIFKTLALKSTVVALLTVKSPFTVVDPVISVDPEMNTAWNKGLMYDAVLAKDAVRANKA